MDKKSFVAVLYSRGSITLTQRDEIYDWLDGKYIPWKYPGGEEVDMSTRPDRPECPICKENTLTGWVKNLLYNTRSEYVTKCQNPECISVDIYLDEDLKVTKVTTKDGGMLIIIG